MLDRKKLQTVGIIFFTIIVLIVGGVFFMFSIAPQYSRSARVTDLDICDISYSEEGLPDAVNVCGLINIDDDANIVELNMYLYKIPNKKLVSSMSQQDDLFEEGFFSKELSLDSGAGSYRVEVWLYRKLIGSVEFSVSLKP